MAAVDLNAVRAIVEGRLATELAQVPSIPVVFHNMPNNPTARSSWVQCLVQFGRNEYLSQGLTAQGSTKVIGVLLCNIFTPKGVGPGANYAIGKRIRDLYNRAIVSGVFFDAADGPAVVDSPQPEPFFQTRVSVTFEFIEDL
jgi:hypothetical protein